MRTDFPYPFLFQPIFKQKVWGGRELQKLGKQLPSPDGTTPPIGESWELVDLEASSPSGGGGGPERSIIANGPLAGLSLQEVMHRFGPRLMGRLPMTSTGEFPLLVKFLDARENLSVQVHPSPQYLADHPDSDAHLKSECWYIVAADPGAVVYKGIRAGVTPAEFRAAIESNDPARVVPLLISVPVKAGDCHYLPSGTCHALGAGVVVAEAQTPSDTTFRVFDWGRKGRAMHVEEAMASIEFGPPDTRFYEKRSHIAGMFTTVSRLITCDYFRLEKVRMIEGYEQEIPYDQPTIWMLLQGRGEIDLGPSRNMTVAFQKGDTLLLPAEMPDDAKVKLHEDTVWLEITFPAAQSEAIA